MMPSIVMDACRHEQLTIRSCLVCDLLMQNNFPYDDVTVNIARGLFGLNMLTTLPLECFVCREVLETYFFAGEFDRNRHLIFTSSLVVTAMFISLLTCDLGIVLELTGGLSATALAFIFPSICYSSSPARRASECQLPIFLTSQVTETAAAVSTAPIGRMVRSTEKRNRKPSSFNPTAR